MKAVTIAITLLVLGSTHARAEQYETYAFGDSEAEACRQVKSDLNDQAILQCRMNGGAFDTADYGPCRTTETERGRFKVFRSVEFSCKPI